MMRWAPLAAVVVIAACEHGDVNQLVTLDGDTLILNISMSTQFGGGVPTGTRTVNRFLATAFDTSLADAFNRSSANPPVLRAEPNAFGYGTITTPIIYPVSGTVTTFVPPNRYLPTLVTPATVVSFYGGANTKAVAYIVPGSHPGNGGNVWEFWYDLSMQPNTRYVMGLARYALQQRGALDHSELLLTGTVTTPDTLVFRAGDFVPAGRKLDGVYTGSCANAGVVQPVAGANPHLIAGATTDAAGDAEIDQTACSNAASAWSGVLGNVKSPVPPNNNTAPGTSQYNFLVIWEALADSTPNYARPVYRQQIGPLMTAAGVVINNSYAPVPPIALTPAQSALLSGATSRPDSVTLAVSNLPPLTSGAYQFWITKSGTDSVVLARGLFEKLINNVVVATSANATDFNGDTAAATYRLRVDWGPHSTVAAYNSVVLAYAPAGASGTTLPAAQQMWATMAGNKNPGAAAPPLVANMTFGNFDNGGAASARWAPAGLGAGGVFGRTLDVQVTHLLRPPVAMYYNAYLRNSTTGAVTELGPITGPFPDYASLLDADVNATGTVNAVEIVLSAVHAEAQTLTDLCGFDRVDVRLEPKTRAAGPFTLVQEASRIIAVSGTSPYPLLPRCQP
jgi:hypothetical protein